MKSSKLWSSQIWTQIFAIAHALRSRKSSGLQRIWTRELGMPVPRSNQLNYEATDDGKSNPQMTNSQCKWSLSSVGWNVAPVSRGHGFKPRSTWSPEVSGFCVRNCVNCVHNCEDHSLLDFTSAFQYMKYFIYNFSCIPHGLIRTHKWTALKVSGFIAQLVGASHRYHKVRGSNPVEVLSSLGFRMQLQKLQFITARIIAYLILRSIEYWVTTLRIF